MRRRELKKGEHINVSERERDGKFIAFAAALHTFFVVWFWGYAHTHTHTV